MNAVSTVLDRIVARVMLSCVSIEFLRMLGGGEMIVCSSETRFNVDELKRAK